MSNFFDQFDGEPAGISAPQETPVTANYFDQFDEPKQEANFFDKFDEADAVPDRAWSDVPSDIAKGLAKGVNSVGTATVQTVDAAGRLLSNIDPVGQSVAYLAPEFTGKLNKTYDAATESASNFFAGNEQAWQESKSPQAQENAKYISGGDGFVDTAKRVAERPQAIPDLVADSAAFMAPSAWVSRAMATAKAAKAAVVAATMGTGAVLDAGATGAQTKREVLEMTPAQLIEHSPDYQAMISEGVDPVEAQATLARSAGFTAQALQLPISFLASKVSGAGKLESEFFTGNGVRDFFSSVAKEVGEEAVQEGSAQANTNAGVKLFADRNRELSQGVGNSIALGVTAGGAQAGGINALGAMVPNVENQTINSEIDQPINGEQSIIEDMPQTSVPDEAAQPLTITPEETISANSQQAPGAFAGVAEYANQQAEAARKSEAYQRTSYLDDEPSLANAAALYGQQNGFIKKTTLEETPDDVEASLGKMSSIDDEINQLLFDVSLHHEQANNEKIERINTAHFDHANKIFDDMLAAKSVKEPEPQPLNAFEKREVYSQDVNANLDAGIDRARDAQMPENMRDVRLLRNRYRTHLSDVAGSLDTHGAALEKTDGLLELAAKNGGLNTEAWSKDGIDPADTKQNRAFSVNGKLTPDDLAELAHQNGFTGFANEQGTPNSNAALNAVNDEMRGTKRYFSTNDEVKLQTAQAAPKFLSDLKGYGSATAIKTAIAKALEGKRLGANQSKIVQEILDRANEHTRDEVSIKNRWEDRAKNMLANKGNRHIEEWRNREDHLSEVTTHEAALTEIMTDAMQQHGIDPEKVKTAYDKYSKQYPSMNQLTTAMMSWVSANKTDSSEHLRNGTQELSGRSPGERGPAQEQPGSPSERNRDETPATSGRIESATLIERGSDSEGRDAGLRQPIAPAIDEIAQEAATSPLNDLPEPTAAQKEAGNYKKAHVKIHALDIAIENSKGSTRSGTAPDGKKWESEMHSHYGYIKRTIGADDENVDVFVGPNPESEKVFIVDQINADGSFDEHKVMLGFDSLLRAKVGYKKNYTKGWKVGEIKSMSVAEFKDWLKNGNTKKPVNARGATPTIMRVKTDPSSTPYESNKLSKTLSRGSIVVDEHTNEHGDFYTIHASLGDGLSSQDHTRIKPNDEEARKIAERLLKERDDYVNYVNKQKADNETATEKNKELAKQKGYTLGAKLGALKANDNKEMRAAFILKDHGDGSFDVQGVMGNKTALFGQMSATNLLRAQKRARGEDPYLEKNESAEKTSENKQVNDVDDTNVVDTEIDKTEANQLTTKGTKLAEKADVKIEDFGKKLEGAKKHTASLRETLSNTSIDTATVPLSRSFPIPDYERLAKSGVPPEVLAFVAQLRGEIKAKPRRGVSVWVQKVDTLRSFANDLLSGAISPESLAQAMRAYGSYVKYLVEVIAIAREILPSQIKDLATYKLEHHIYSIYKDEKNVGKWLVINTAQKGGAFSRGGKETHFDTKEEALAFIKAQVSTADDSGKPLVKFDVWTIHGEPDVWVGKKLGARKYIELKKFRDAKTARAFIASNNDELVQIFKNKKQIGSERRAEQNERVGKDYRRGANVTQDLFAKTFGFRGVQFGNYVENDRRQQDLNNAYDGLLDLADVLGIPPEAISLNGELGLAFGARGTGGKQPASAHYEAGDEVTDGRVIINLTKNSGPGSLAHEWWHGLDNYFARMGKVTSRDGSYLTELERPKRQQVMRDGRPTITPLHPDDFGVRPEVYDAFKSIVNTIREKTDLIKRSGVLDNRRTKDYWSTTRELTARSFERFVIDELASKGYESDYLATILPKHAWDANEGFWGNTGETYPYPTDDEAPVSGAAFKELFDTIATKETDAGVALYSRRDDGKEFENGLSEDQVQATFDKFIKLYKGASDVELRILGSSSEFPGYNEERDGGSRLDASYQTRQGLLSINRRAFSDTNTLEAALREELLVHKGLGLFAPEGRRQIYENIKRAVKEDKTGKLTKIWADTESNYSSQADDLELDGEERNNLFAEEFLGKVAQIKVSPLAAGFSQLYLAIKRALVKIGLIENSISLRELQNVVHNIGGHFKDGREAPKRNWIADVKGTSTRKDNRAQAETLYSRKSPDDTQTRSGGFSVSGNPQIESDAFKKWFGDSKVVDENGKPLIVYRGQHGDSDDIETKLGSITFGSAEIASNYAINPNDRNAKVKSPKLFPVYLSIKNPLMHSADDPFIELGDVWSKLGKETAMRAAIDNADRIYNTSVWADDYSEKYRSVEELIAINPAQIRELYVEAFPLFDSPWFVEAAKSAGFDGAIHGEYGYHTEAGEHAEYRVFDKSQIKSINNNGSFDSESTDILYSRKNPQSNLQNNFSVSGMKENKVYGISTDAILRIWQDKMRPLLRTQSAINESGGNISEAENAYLQEEAFHGKTENDLRKMKERFLEPMSQTMAANGIEREELDMYLWAKHAQERNEQIAKINEDMPDGGSGMTTAQSEEILQKAKTEGKHKALEKLASTVYSLLDEKRRIARFLAGDEAVDTWNEVYKFYVPLKGQAVDDSGGNFPRVGKGFDIRGKESMRALGRRTKPESPTLHSIKDTTEAIIRYRKNEVGNALLALVEANPNPEYWEVHDSSNPNFERKLLTKKGKDYVGSAKVISKEDYFTTKRDGKEFFIRIEDPLLMRAMKNMGPEKMSWAVQHLAKASRFLSAMCTSYNPEFVVTNFARDIQTAVINLQAEIDLHDGKIKGKQITGKMIQGVMPAMRAVYASLNGKSLTGDAAAWQKSFDEFRNDGANTGWYQLKDIDQQAKELQGLIDMQKKTFIGRALRTRKSIGDFVNNANGAVENAIRLSVYKNAIDAGITRKQSASLAKNLTVNFNRKGEIGASMNAVYMFFNASVQGTAALARALGTLKVDETGKRKLNMAQKAAVGIMIVSYGLAALNRSSAGDDEDEKNWWDKVPAHEKERNIIVMKSALGGEKDGTFWKFPMPYGYNIFNAIAVSSESAVNGGKGIGEAAGEILMSILGAFSPLGIAKSNSVDSSLVRSASPTVLKPLADLTANENFFGSKIFAENMDFDTPKPNSHLSMRSTNEVWKWIAEFMNDSTGGSAYRSGAVDISPDKMNYIFNYFMGSAGKFYSDIVTDGIKFAQDREIKTKEIPFVRKFVGEVDWRSGQGEFYERKERIAQANEELKSINDPAERAAFRFEHGKVLNMSLRANATAKKLTAIRKQKNRIIDDENLSQKEKDEKIKPLDLRTKAALDSFSKNYKARVGE